MDILVGMDKVGRRVCLHLYESMILNKGKEYKNKKVTLNLSKLGSARLLCPIRETMYQEHVQE